LEAKKRGEPKDDITEFGKSDGGKLSRKKFRGGGQGGTHASQGGELSQHHDPKSIGKKRTPGPCYGHQDSTKRNRYGREVSGSSGLDFVL